MSETHPTPARSSLRWALLILVVIAIAALLWWLWPAPNNEAPQRPGGRPGFGAFGGAVPVRVAKVEQGEFEVFNKALGSVTPLNTVNLRSRVAGELVELRFEEGQCVKKGDLLAVIDPRPYKVALQQAEGTLQQNRAQLKNAQVDFERYRGLYADDSIAKQTLDTQEALVSQYQGTLAANQAAVNEARLNLEFTQIRAPIDGRVGLRQLDVGNLVAANDTTPLVVITQTQPMSISFTLPEGDLLPVLTRYRQGDKLVVQIWDRGEKVMFGEGVLESIDNQIDATTGTAEGAFRQRAGTAHPQPVRQCSPAGRNPARCRADSDRGAAVRLARHLRLRRWRGQQGSAASAQGRAEQRRDDGGARGARGG